MEVSTLTTRLLAGTAMLVALMYAAPAVPEAGDADAETVLTEPVPQHLLLDYLADPDTFTLVDARTPEEYEAAHISGAVNIPYEQLDEFSARLPEVRDAPIVIYCRTGRRAAALQAELVERGYRNVRTLKAEQILWSDELAVFNCAAAPAENTDPSLTAPSSNKEEGPIP